MNKTKVQFCNMIFSCPSSSIPTLVTDLLTLSTDLLILSTDLLTY